MRYVVLVCTLSLTGCQYVPLPEEYREKIEAIDERDAMLRSEQAELRDRIEEGGEDSEEMRVRIKEIDLILDSTAEEIANLRSSGRRETVADQVETVAPVVGSLAAAYGGPGAGTLAMAVLAWIGSRLRRKEENARDAS